MTVRSSQTVARLERKIAELERQNAQLRGLLADTIEACDAALKEAMDACDAALDDQPPGRTGGVVSARQRDRPDARVSMSPRARRLGDWENARSK